MDQIHNSRIMGLKYKETGIIEFGMYEDLYYSCVNLKHYFVQVEELNGHILKYKI